MNHITPYVIEGAFMLGIIGFMWKMSAENSRKTNTLFRRFDDYKKEVKNEHVSKDVCKIIHENMNRDIQEIKSDVKTLLNRETK